MNSILKVNVLGDVCIMDCHQGYWYFYNEKSLSFLCVNSQQCLSPTPGWCLDAVPVSDGANIVWE